MTGSPWAPMVSRVPGLAGMACSLSQHALCACLPSPFCFDTPLYSEKMGSEQPALSGWV